jgi:HK97 family phage major capsid protein
MAKEKFNFRSAYETIEANNARLGELAAKLEQDKEREDYTDAEKGEIKQISRENAILEMKIKANTQNIVVEKREDVEDANKKMRECLSNGQRFELKVSRAVASDFGGNVSGYGDYKTSTNPYGITMGDIVAPLYAQNILSAIGSPLLTGLKGNYQWPVVETFEASINDEGVELGDTKIPVNKLTAKPERIGVAVPITREALTETDNLLQTICTQYIPVAAASLMNKIMFSQTKVTGATDLIGPFVSMKTSHKKTYKTDAPTLKDLLNLKGIVLGENIMPEGLCYVMTETTKAALEGTPKWDGASASIVDDNGKINGVPVFTSSYVNEGDVLFGSFKYAPQGLFGDMNLIVDPYTKARKNAIDFVLNADYAITVLRQEAFAILTKSAS